MASSSLQRHRRPYSDESLMPSEMEADNFSKEEDRAPSSKRQKPSDSFNSTRPPAPTIPFSGDINQPSLFELQIEEMLREVRPNYAKVMGPVDTALRKLKTLIESIEDRKPLPIAEATKLAHKTQKFAIPFPDPKPNSEAAYRLAYSQPSEINLVGSYMLQTMTKEDCNMEIDMVVTLPESILQEKDYLNYRYFYKRAFYISCIAADLQEKAVDKFDMCFEYLGDNDLLPILILKPSKSFGQSESFDLNYRIRIIPAAPQDFFPASKLHPTKNAIRSKSASEAAANSSHPTPFYNATLQADSTFSSYLKLLCLIAKNAPGFKDACILGRIWLRQRGFRGTISDGGFGHFEWAVLTALLLQGGGPKGQAVLSPDYTSYQLFKAVIQYLASHNLVANPILFHSPEITWPKVASPTFFDGPRGHNFLFKMTPWSYEMLHREAQICIEMLNDVTVDHFEAMFIIRKDNPLQQYDSLLKLPIPKVIGDQQNTDHMSRTTRFASNVYNILKEGLTDRVKTIQLMPPRCTSWSLKLSGPTSHADMLVGFVVDPANVDRAVDHGPAAENRLDAARFRKFWGDKAELRRFKDGSILESLVWSNDSKGPVFREIVTYILRRHLGAEIGANIKFMDNEMSQGLPGYELFSTTYSSLRTAFNTLEQNLRAVEGLPLQLKILSAIDSQLRYCSVQPSTFSPGQYLRDPAEVLIQFEGSGRWPDNLLAIQRTKIAFLLKIGDLLEAFVAGLITRLGLENTDRVLCNCAYLDVVYPSGAVFRLRIYVDREKILLERQLKHQARSAYTREDVVTAKSLLSFKFILLPLHTQSMFTQCTRYPKLSPTIQLVKKWFHSHMLSTHIKEEVVELIVMHIFLRPYPWRAPSSVMTGFWRVLQFISRWDWRTTPLIVDFSGTMSSRDMVAIQTRHTAWRKIDPGMNRVILFVASNHDTTGTAFTDEGPSKVVAARMTALARSAWLIANNETVDLDMTNIFESSTKDYDFIIHISPQLIGGRSWGDRKQNRFKNIRLQDHEGLPHSGYDPVQLFLAELEILYTTCIVFFQDPSKRSTIAGIWNPYITSRSFKASIPYSTSPITCSSVQDGGQPVEIDRCAILSDISRLGGDMIVRIEVHR